MYTHFVYLILICTDEMNIDDEMLENVDSDTYGDKKADHVIRYRVYHIIDLFFKNEIVVVQTKLLKIFLTSRKLKEAMNLLGIQKSTKYKKNEGKCDTKYK